MIRVFGIKWRLALFALLKRRRKAHCSYGVTEQNREAYCSRCRKTTKQAKTVRRSDDQAFWKCRKCGRLVYT